MHVVGNYFVKKIHKSPRASLVQTAYAEMKLIQTLFRNQSKEPFQCLQRNCHNFCGVIGTFHKVGKSKCNMHVRKGFNSNRVRNSSWSPSCGLVSFNTVIQSSFNAFLYASGWKFMRATGPSYPPLKARWKLNRIGRFYSARTSKSFGKAVEKYLGCASRRNKIDPCR